MLLPKNLVRYLIGPIEPHQFPLYESTCVCNEIYFYSVKMIQLF